MRDATARLLLQGDTIDHHVDEVLDLLVQRARFAFQAHHFSVDAHAREAFLLKVGEQLREFALAPGHDGRHDHGLRIRAAEPKDLVGHLIGGLSLDLTAAFGAMRDAHPRVEQAQVIVYLCGGSHR